MSNAMQLAKKPELQSLVRIDSLDDVMTLGQVLAKSGYFQDARDAGQAVVKILAGRELGFPPIASMTGIYIVKGKVSLSSNLMAAAIKRSGRYDYKVKSLTPEGCEIAFYENGEEIGISKFDKADAAAAKLLDGENYRKFPRNMYFSRALSNGAKWYCPDLSNGPLYTPDELGLTVDGETGEVINPPQTPQPAQTLPPIGGRRANTGAELVAFVEKVADYYEITDHDEVFEVRKDNGAVVCSCGADGKNPCQHRLAVKLWVVEQKAKEQPATVDAEAEPEAVNDEPEPPTEITDEQHASLCELTKQMEDAGIDEDTWRSQMENLTGSRSRKGLMQDELSKVIFSFNQALAGQQRKGGKAKVQK